MMKIINVDKEVTFTSYFLSSPSEGKELYLVSELENADEWSFPNDTISSPADTNFPSSVLTLDTALSSPVSF